MNFLSPQFLFFASGLFFGTIIAFLESMIFGDFEGMGSAISLSAIGACAFAFAIYIADMFAAEPLIGFIFAVVLALVCWTVAFQFTYEYAFMRAFLYAFLIATLSAIVAIGLPGLLVRF
jgi:hypothetical protein